MSYVKLLHRFICSKHTVHVHCVFEKFKNIYFSKAIDVLTVKFVFTSS